jgi:hypothetical protein
METTTPPQNPVPDARRLASARALAEAAEAAIADLEQRLPLGISPLEQALAARIRAAIEQLRACTEQLAGDELMIEGSTGQQRPHPMLKASQDLRREISDGLKELTFRAENRALVERMNALHRRAGRGNHLA